VVRIIDPTIRGQLNVILIEVSFVLVLTAAALLKYIWS